MAPAPVKCYGHKAVWLDGLLYVGGGMESEKGTHINCYDPVSNSWISRISTSYCHFSMAIMNNKLLIAGGMNKRDKMTNQILAMDDGQLKNYTKMDLARSNATAIGHQGMLIITGGEDDKRKTLSSTELFDSGNGQWYICSDLPQPLSELQSLIVSNILYLVGGYNKDGNGSPTVFTAPLNALSKHQLTWTTYQDTPWCHSAPVSIDDTHLLIIGGCKKMRNKDVLTSDIYKLNNVSHSWEAIGQIPLARSSMTAVSANDKIIVIGGWNEKGSLTNTVWIGSCTYVSHSNI